MTLQSWGLYPRVKNKVTLLKNEGQLTELFQHEHEPMIPYGNGRSYGDSALNDHILHCRPHRYFLGFDEDSGVLHCQSGVLLSEILDVFVPRGWFFEVSPGTKLITVGGAIASDVHGKNHHTHGSFSSCVEEFTLMLPSGDKKICKPGDEFFKATCGGMGLTGVILDAKIRLKRIRSKYINQTSIRTKNLEETFAAFEKYADVPYSVAWIDCLAKGDAVGRSILMVGDFADDGDLSYKPKCKIGVPFTFPSFALNTLSVRAFNWLYYHKTKAGESQQKVGLDTFFYPLDSIDNWNRIYGKNGFVQYQFILPKAESLDGLREILSAISASGKGSFLAVLKLYGAENENMLSFPMEGYSLALDFKIEPGIFQLLNQLDDIVLKYKGRFYLAKDARISADVFAAGYPKIEAFKAFRKKHGMDKTLQSKQSIRVGL